MKRPVVSLCVCLLFSVALLEAQGSRAGQGQTQTQGSRAGQDFANNAFSEMEEAFAQQEATLLDAYYLGRAVAANILNAYKPYTENAALTRYVNSICQTIVINSSYPDIFNGYHVIILDSQEFNALASPGGHIFLTRALVEAAASEDMLAAIIAHELAHIMLKHSLSMIDNLRFNDEMSAMADRAAKLAGNTQAASRLQYFRNSVAATIDTLLINGFSQDQEFEADAGAVVLLAASGYSPAGLLDMLNILQRVQSSQKGGFNSTHPSPAQRIENVRKYVGQYTVQDTRTRRAGRFRNK
jgi:beta-barrel assembly-enhancing protease